MYKCESYQIVIPDGRRTLFPLEQTSIQIMNTPNCRVPEVRSNISNHALNRNLITMYEDKILLTFRYKTEMKGGLMIVAISKLTSPITLSDVRFSSDNFHPLFQVYSTD